MQSKQEESISPEALILVYSGEEGGRSIEDDGSCYTALFTRLLYVSVGNIAACM